MQDTTEAERTKRAAVAWSDELGDLLTMCGLDISVASVGLINGNKIMLYIYPGSTLKTSDIPTEWRGMKIEYQKVARPVTYAA